MSIGGYDLGADRDDRAQPITNTKHHHNFVFAASPQVPHLSAAFS